MTAVVYRFQLMSFQRYCDHILFWHFSINLKTLFCLANLRLCVDQTGFYMTFQYQNPVWIQYFPSFSQRVSIYEYSMYYICLYALPLSSHIHYTSESSGKKYSRTHKKTTCFFNLNLDHVFYETYFFWRQLMI